MTDKRSRVRVGTAARRLSAMPAGQGLAYELEARERRAVRRAIAVHLAEHGWRFRRGSSAPWREPGADPDASGYSLRGAAARQIELEKLANGITDLSRHVG